MPPGDGFEVLSRALWRIALLEVPPNEREFVEVWASLVSYCNRHGSFPKEDRQDPFSSYPDPALTHEEIEPSQHTFLNKLWCMRDR
jgi:hypothetical protein